MGRQPHESVQVRTALLRHKRLARTPHSVDDVLATVEAALAARGLRLSRGYPLLIREWTSRTANLYRVRVDADETHDVVVKVLKDVSHASLLGDMLTELAAVLSTDRSGKFLPVPLLASSDAVGCVVMPFVKGSSLREILEGQGTGPFSRGTMLELVTQSGRMLALYHARFSERSDVRLDEAWNDLDFRVKTVFGPSTAARNVLKPSGISRSYSDFHPGHVIVTNQHKLALIDPPYEQHQYLFVARDLACFIDKMLVTPRSALRAPFRRCSHAELTSAFMRGYESACAVPLTAGDRTVIDVNLAFLLKRRVRRIVAARRWVKLMYYGIPLAYHYRRVMRRLRTTHAFSIPEASPIFSSWVKPIPVKPASPSTTTHVRP